MINDSLPMGHDVGTKSSSFHISRQGLVDMISTLMTQTVLIQLMGISLSARSHSSREDMQGPTERSYGGKIVDYSMYPYHVTPIIISSHIYTCNGALIDDQWIITVATCAYNDSAKAKVAFGITDLTGVDLSDKSYWVRDLIFHPMWSLYN